MAAGPLLINGTDVLTLGFRLSTPTGWLDIAARTHPTVVRPGRAGAYLSGQIQEQTRKVSLAGWIDAASDAAARSAVDGLRSLLLKAVPATIVLPDSATRQITAYLEAHVTDVGTGPVLIQRTLKARLDLLLLDPYAYDITTTSVTLGAGVNRALLGTAPSFPVITINGAATNPTISLVRYDGTVLATLTLTITTIAGDTLIIDMDKKTILKNGASAISTISAGDFFAMDPATAQNGLGVNATDQPYVTSSSGAGTTAYKRAWR